MGLFRRSPLPSYLNPKDGRGNVQDQKNVQEQTGGDIRKFKLSHIMVSDETIRDIDECLQKRRHGTEYVKMYSGSYRERIGDMPDFVKVCKKNDVIPYVGGGATEKAMRAQSLPAFVKELHRLGIDTIEISNSVGDMPTCETTGVIRGLRKDFTNVLVEIGAKASGCYEHQDLWHRDLDTALAMDPAAIILEGKGTGNSGIYNAEGRPNNLLVTSLCERAGDQKDRFLIEAPYEIQRYYWMSQMFGWNARLGNIPLNNSDLEKTELMRVAHMQSEERANIEVRRRAHHTLYREVLLACKEHSVDVDKAVFHRGFQALAAGSLIQDKDWKNQLRRLIASLNRPAMRTIVIPVGILDILRRMMGDCDEDV